MQSAYESPHNDRSTRMCVQEHTHTAFISLKCQNATDGVMMSWLVVIGWLWLPFSPPPLSLVSLYLPSVLLSAPAGKMKMMSQASRPIIV